MVEPIPTMIRRLANEYGAPPETMLAIARAESTLNPRADNPTSTADGLFQIINGTWKAFGCTGDKYDPEDNARCAMEIATTSGLHHWDASSANW